MPLDPRVERFLQLLAPGQSHAGDSSLAHRRDGLIELMKLSGPHPPIAGHRDCSLPTPNGQLAVRIYTPSGAAQDPLNCLIYFHGGGLVAGSVATHEPVARALAHYGDCRIISVQYRLAPEHPFPAAVDDALAAVIYIAANAQRFGVNPHRLGVCGDSAGALLTAATCQTLASMSGAPKLALQLLLCPILDFSRRSDSRRAFASGYLVDERMIAGDLLHYAPAGSDLSDPRISPLCAPHFAGMPPTIIHAAEFDPFRDEALEYFQRLRENQSKVSYTCHVGMIHLFYALGAVIPQAKTAFQQIGSEIRAALEAGEFQ